MRWMTAGLALALLWEPTAVAEPPVIENAELEIRSGSAGIEETLALNVLPADEALWFGWQVPMGGRNQSLCCWSRKDRRWQPHVCELEGRRRHFVFSSDEPGDRARNGQLVVLLRLDGEVISELQAYSADCPLDALGRRLIWLEAIEPDVSADFLGRLAVTEPRLAEESLMALALHRTSKAHDLLARLGRTAADGDLRKEALFWLAQTESPKALEVLLAALSYDPDPEVREQTLFAISQLPDGGGAPVLLELLRDRDRPPTIRREAFFWFVQSEGDRALELIDQILSE